MVENSKFCCLLPVACIPRSGHLSRMVIVENLNLSMSVQLNILGIFLKFILYKLKLKLYLFTATRDK